MKDDKIRLYDLTDIRSPGVTFAEIERILKLVAPSLDPSFLRGVFNDIVSLFKGGYPGYRASNTKYHDLEHTCAVTLAAARLIHGLHVRGHSLNARIAETGIIAALFHDTGLIQKEDENEGTGAQFTIGHEERSIALMEEYLSGREYPSANIEDGKHIIMCTILSLPVREIPFNSDEAETMGKVLGSADLMAQVADRNYLEKLPLLFMEFKEAGIPGFETSLELFNSTGEFYHTVVRTRLAEEMDNVSAAALDHFRARWGLERDLYAESMKNNIKYMREIQTNCDKNYDCFLDKARRSN